MRDHFFVPRSPHKNIGEIEGLIWAKKPKRLPTVYTRTEVKAILSHLKGAKWLMVSLLYGAGLRLKECLRLRVKDIEFEYKQIIVQGAKGDKDRVTVLPDRLLIPLKEQIRKVKKLHEQDLKD